MSRNLSPRLPPTDRHTVPSTSPIREEGKMQIPVGTPGVSPDPSFQSENESPEKQWRIKVAETPNFKNEFAQQQSSTKKLKIARFQTPSSPFAKESLGDSSSPEPLEQSNASDFNGKQPIEYRKTKKLKSQREIRLPNVVEQTSSEDSQDSSDFAEPGDASYLGEIKQQASIMAGEGNQLKSEYHYPPASPLVGACNGNRSEDLNKRSSEVKAKKMFLNLDFSKLKREKKAEPSQPIINKTRFEGTPKLKIEVPGSDKLSSDNEGHPDDGQEYLFSNLSLNEGHGDAEEEEPRKVDEIELIFREEDAMRLDKADPPPPKTKYTYHLPPKQSPRYYARSSEFKFTEPTKEERKFRRLQAYGWIVALTIDVVLFVLIINLLHRYLDNFDGSEDWKEQSKRVQTYGVCLLVALFLGVVALNFLVIFPLGSLAIRAIVYPYSFWVSEQVIIGANSIRYGADFAALTEKLYILMRTQMIDTAATMAASKLTTCSQPIGKSNGAGTSYQAAEPYEHHPEPESPYFKQKRAEMVDYYRSQSYYDINSKFSMIINLANMFSETNRKVIQQKMSSLELLDPLFVQLTQVLCSMSVLLYRIDVRIKDSFGMPIIISLSEYYSENYIHFRESSIPTILRTASNFEHLEQFEDLCQQFQKIVHLANNPISLGCCRINCFGLVFKNLFHSNDQTELMLAKNFDGRKFWVKAPDGTKIDCMFFPFNDEKVRTVEERAQLSKQFEESLDCEMLRVSFKDLNPEYLKYPTVIFFNPNAQCYQQQVHPPNCFWLKFFVSNNINVMAWNYRDYGRSRGMPDPFTCNHDGEAILQFMIKTLGLKGKLGCFGRSLGGTVATHLAKNYPQHIEFLFVDRSFGDINKMSDSLMLGKYNRLFFNIFSRGWKIHSARNFYEANCFKMVAQDPNDDMIDRFCALNAEVARLACEDYFGDARSSFLKVEKAYMAMRMLFRIDSKLQVVLKQQSKLEKKVQLIKRRQIRQQFQEQQNNFNQWEMAGYIGPDFKPIPVLSYQGTTEKTTGYSTDMDHLARSKKFLAIENRWKLRVSANLVSGSKLNSLMTKKIKENFRHYESMAQSLFRVVTFLSDFDGGVINLMSATHPNTPCDHTNLTSFVDNLFTYGSGYIENYDFYNVLGHRKRRMQSMEQITQIIAVLKLSRDEVKSTPCKYEEDGLKQLILACFSSTLKFFEALKKQMKKSETLINFNPKDVGHLVPLTTGHTDRPTEQEAKYIRTLIKSSDFQYVEEEPEGISPSPMLKPGESGVLPNINKTVDSPPLRLQKNKDLLAESSAEKENKLSNKLSASPKPILKQSRNSQESEEKKTETKFGIRLKPLDHSEQDSVPSDQEDVDQKSAIPSSKAKRPKVKSAVKSCRSTKTMKSFKCYASDRDERESFYKLSVKPSTSSHLNFLHNLTSVVPKSKKKNLRNSRPPRQAKSHMSAGQRKAKLRGQVSKRSLVPEVRDSPKLIENTSLDRLQMNASEQDFPPNSFLSSNSSINTLTTPTKEIDRLSSITKSRARVENHESPPSTLIISKQKQMSKASDVKEEQKAQQVSTTLQPPRWTFLGGSSQFNRFNKNFSFQAKLGANFELKEGYALHNDSSRMTALAQYLRMEQRERVTLRKESDEAGLCKISQSPNVRSMSVKPSENTTEQKVLDITSD